MIPEMHTYVNMDIPGGLAVTGEYEEALERLRQRRKINPQNIWNAINREAEWKPDPVPAEFEEKVQAICDITIRNNWNSVGTLMFLYDIETAWL